MDDKQIQKFDFPRQLDFNGCLGERKRTPAFPNLAFFFFFLMLSYKLKCSLLVNSG